LKHESQGRRYVFIPRVEKEAASGSALQRIVRNFFDGSVPKAVVSLLDMDKLSRDELESSQVVLDEVRDKKA